MKCPRCGKQLPPGAEECPYCGYEINVESLLKQSFPEGAEDDSESISSNKAGILIAAIIVVVAVIGYMVMR